MIIRVAIPLSHRTAPARIDHGAGRRLPLYVYGRTATQVGLDGPALLVRHAGKTPVRYPLSRVSRIISGATVEWSARALSACLERDLPIVFLDRAGQPAGYLHAAQTKPSRLDDILVELLDRPDGLQHYALWLRSERMRLLEGWRKHRRAAGHEVEESEYREMVRQHVYRHEGAPMGLTGEPLYRGAVSAYAIEQVRRAGARPVYWGLDGQPLRLADDLADLLSLSLYLELRGMGAAAHGEDAALLTVLHSFGQTLVARCGHTLARLHRFGKELLEEWR